MVYNVDPSLNKSCGIYVIRNSINSKVYIGSTVEFRGRFLDHSLDLRKGKHHAIKLQRFCNKYGYDTLTFEILNICPTRDAALELEQIYLDIRKPFFNSSKSATSNFGSTRTPKANLPQSTTSYSNFYKNNISTMCDIIELSNMCMSNSSIILQLGISKSKLCSFKSEKGPHFVKLRKDASTLCGKTLKICTQKEIQRHSSDSKFTTKYGSKDIFREHLDKVLSAISIGVPKAEAVKNSVFNTYTIYAIINRSCHIDISKDILSKYNM